MKIELSRGQKGVVTWEENPKGASSVKSSRFDDKPTTKIILPMTGFNPKVGESWMCEVVHENDSHSRKTGCYFVRGIHKKFVIKWPAGFWVDPNVADEIAQDIADPGVNVMLVGPQGCGKTKMSGVIAESLGYEFFPIDCTLIRGKLDWLGSKELGQSEGATVTLFREAELVLALRQARTHLDKTFVIFLDELNRCPMDARNSLLRVIYGEERNVRLPSGEIIPVGGNVKFIAAINEGAGFGGTAGMDSAFADRFSRHKVSYPPAMEEFKILKDRFPEANDTDLHNVVAIANGLRIRFKEGDISKTISMRMTENAARRLANGSDLRRAVISAIVNQYEGDKDDTGSEAGQVWKLITGMTTL